MASRIVNNIYQNKLINNHLSKHYFFSNDEYLDKSFSSQVFQKIEKNLNKIKNGKNRKNKIIPFIFSKIEVRNNIKKYLNQLGNRNVVYNKENIFKRKKVFFPFDLNAYNIIIIVFLIFQMLFKECSLTYIYLNSSTITIKIKESGMQNIFFGEERCYKLRPKFDFPDRVIINGVEQNPISAQHNFRSTNNVIQLKWNGIKDNWGCLFKDCININEIDLSQFDFSQNVKGNMMFRNCKSLTSINFNGPRKFKIVDGGSFFRESSALSSLDLTNFDTTGLTDIGRMFEGCSSLTSLDLSSFQTNENQFRKLPTPVFLDCPKLEYINFKNAYFNPNSTYPEFVSGKKNLVFCNQDDRITSMVRGHECYAIGCQSNWRQIQKKINLANNQCVNDCSSTSNNRYNYNNECHGNCPIRTYNDNFICKDCHTDCRTCEKGAEASNTNCKSCSDISKALNMGNCVSNCLNGFYFDEIDTSIKICKCDLIKCYKCTKESFEQNLCISCNNENGYYPKYDDYINGNVYFDCYQSIEGYYLDSGYFKSCYESCQICDEGGDNVSHNCIECKSNYNYELNLYAHKNCYTESEYENLINDDTYFHKILEFILTIYEPEKQDNIAITRANDAIYRFSNTKNELQLLRNNSYDIYNMSIIDLAQCETILKHAYNISESDSLIIIKNEIWPNKPPEKNISFEVYDPYFKTKLNLSLCDDTPINIYCVMELSQEIKQLYEKIKEYGYDMFNIYDRFYQDICTPYDASKGTDILLIDRINYIYHNNDTQCQPNCQFSYYFVESVYLKCSCLTNENYKYDNSIIDKFNSKKIYESFYDVLKYSNYDILKCYKIITNISVIKSNIGSIITIAFFLCFLICLFIYLCTGINPLKTKLRAHIKNETIKNNSNMNSNIIQKKRKNKIIYIKKFGKNIQDDIFNSVQIYSIQKSSSKRIIQEKSKSKMNIQNKKVSENNNKRIYSDYELNEFEYIKALKYDKRNLFQIYWASLKREHLIFFTFFSCNDYNLLTIKIIRFVFLIVGDMALSTFFFSDDSMHKLFLNYGKYDFVQQIPQITYSTVISLLIETFLCYLSLTDKYFFKLKSNLIKGGKNKNKKILNCIRIKLLFYLIFVFIFFIIYWYIISVFCGVYRNTQIAFIKDSVVSFITGSIYPLVLYFISACLRYCSLKNKKKRCKFIYNLSYMIPLF